MRRDRVRVAARCVRRAIRQISAAALAVSIAGTSVGAQQESLEVRGRVIASGGAPIAGAVIEITGRLLAPIPPTMTAANGGFSVRFARGNGRRLLVTAHRVGFSAGSVVVDTDSLQRDWTITMRVLAYGLPAAVTTDKRLVTPRSRRDLGSSSAATNSSIALALPVEPGDLVALAERLDPGVVRVVESDALSSALSIGGQPPGYTGITIDGATADGLDVPSEAMASVRTFTSTYDVSRGQFASGQLAVTTRTGTETWQGVASAWQSRPMIAASPLGLGASTAWDPRRTVLTVGGGGPLARRWLYGYGAIDVGMSSASPLWLSNPSARTQGSSGIVADSVTRIVSIARGLGLSDQIRSTDRIRATDMVGMFRLDSPLTETTTATGRFDLAVRDGDAGNSQSLSGVSATRRRTAGGVLMALNTASGGFANQARISVQGSDAHDSPTGERPAAVIQVASTAGDSVRVGVVSIGGPGTPVHPTTSRVLELADDVAWTTSQGGLRVSTGVVGRVETTNRLVAAADRGTFDYANIGDFESNHPSAYTRRLSGSDAASIQTEYGAAYAGIGLRHGSSAGLTVGLRAEVRRYRSRGGVRSPVWASAPKGGAEPPIDASLSPRVGFRLEPSSNVSVFGGLGVFVAAVRSSTLANVSARATTGAEYLTCVGSATPIPTWDAYAGDSATGPTQCADGYANLTSRARPAVVFAPAFRAPRVLRSSLGLQVGMGLATLAYESSFAASNTEPLATDRNFAETDAFELVSEGARHVFAKTTDIDTATGRIAPAASRVNRDLSVVREIDGTGSSTVVQHTLQLAGLVPGTFGTTLLWFGYAFTDATVRNTSIGFPGSYAVPTGDGPNDLSWMPSSVAPRHAIVAGAEWYPRIRGLRVSVAATFRSGVPFTPMVAGDINGDGLLNDRAFVFDAASLSDTMAMRTLMRLRSTGATSGCLRAMTGHVATAGGCSGPWVRNVNAAVHYTPKPFPNVSLTLTAHNMLVGFDRLWHTNGSLSGWGDGGVVDDRLLFPVGFDATMRQFRYRVNPEFGLPRRDLRSTNPFRLELRVRVTLGGDPARPATGGNPTVETQRQEIEQELGVAIVNIPSRVLDLAARGLIDLVPDQIIRLHLVMDSLQARIDPNIAALSSSIVGSDGPRGDAAAAMRRALIQEAQEIIDTGVRSVREILGPDLWDELPASLRAPSRDIPEALTGRVRIRSG